jgi:long-chain acyl-CoA synthetase
VTAGGKNVAPQNLENELKAHKVVSQALVVGDRKPYVAALVTIDRDAIDGWSEPEVHAAVQAAIDDVNADRSRYEQIKRFAILPRDFTQEDGEVTPTLKLKRKVILEHFAAQVDALYS